GASGLGAAVVAKLAAAGAKPVVLDVRAPDSGTDWERVDLADARAAERVVAAVVDRLGGVDAVVTCAGVDACGRLEDVAAEEWDRVIAVNLIGTAAVVRAALPRLADTHGRVVTVASTLGRRAVSD